MGEWITFLITILYSDQLIQCALKFKHTEAPESLSTYYMEKEAREVFRELLPSHVKNMGPIVNVEPIFDSHTVEIFPEAVFAYYENKVKARND